VLDHGDQVALAARIASRHPEVGAAERARYQVVLLDEYQDTSHAQLVLLRSLFGGGHPVTAVGDPCQSIYGWRGASAGNLRRFTADFPVVARVRPFGASASSGPAPVLQLSTSFRNSARVLDAAAAIQTELRYEAPRRPPADLRAGPGRAGRGDLRPARDDPRRGRVGGGPGRRAAGRRAWHRPRRAAVARGPGREVRPSDIAVLCRKRSQFVPLRHALEARGIPVEVVGLGGLLAVPEVQDVVCTLRVLHDAGASDALARLLTGPRLRIGRATWSRSAAAPAPWPAARATAGPSPGPPPWSRTPRTPWPRPSPT
jgi:DNA helicase-2/ATP-dependent DNA helicase PcrA